jgi:hypothetical protein
MENRMAAVIVLSWFFAPGMAAAQSGKPTPGMTRHLTAAQGHPHGKKIKNHPIPTPTVLSYSATPGNTFGNHGSNPSTATGSTNTLKGTNASDGNGDYIGGTYGNGNGSLQ